jgi:hypothetical protein
MSDLVERLRIRQPLLGKLCDEAAARIEALEAALRIFASDEVWRVNGICNPNSGFFDGQSIARAALAPEQDK